MTKPDMPSITAVIATRDRPELLRKALRAVFAQDYAGPIDAVVVYDQSPPDPQLSIDFADHPLTVIENTHTPGLAGARNSGVNVENRSMIISGSGTITFVTGYVVRFLSHNESSSD